MVYAQPRNESPYLDQMTKHSDSHQKENNLTNRRHCLPAHHQVKLKEREKKDRYLGLFRELKKLWNM